MAELGTIRCGTRDSMKTCPKLETGRRQDVQRHMLIDDTLRIVTRRHSSEPRLSANSPRVVFNLAHDDPPVQGPAKIARRSFL